MKKWRLLFCFLIGVFSIVYSQELVLGEALPLNLSSSVLNGNTYAVENPNAIIIFGYECSRITFKKDSGGRITEVSYIFSNAWDDYGDDWRPLFDATHATRLLNSLRVTKRQSGFSLIKSFGNTERTLAMFLYMKENSTEGYLVTWESEQKKKTHWAIDPDYISNTLSIKHSLDLSEMINLDIWD
jgi:hypothetical protein